MNMLVSDYDDTLYTDKFNIKINARKIREFREAGNIFTIATARSFQSVKIATNINNIPYDYLICMDGATIFDKNDNIIVQNPLRNDEVIKINQLLQTFNKLMIINYYSAIDWNNAKNKKILGYYLVSPYFRKLKTFITSLQDELPDLEFDKGLMYCYISRFITNKSIAIKELNKVLKLDSSNIFTIGNGKNDLEMINDYNGYEMLIHHYLLNKVAIGTYTSVHKLIDDIMNGTCKRRR